MPDPIPPDSELMLETHWCPWCDNAHGMKPHRIEREGSAIPVLLVRCDTHGEQAHEPHDTDCWCLK